MDAKTDVTTGSGADDRRGAKASFRHGLLEHIVAATGICAAVNPLYTVIDQVLAGVQVEQSVEARFEGVAWTYTVSGLAYDRFRERWWRAFEVAERSERMQKLHDAAYCTAFNAVFLPIVYTVSMLRKGEFDPRALGHAWFYGTVLAPPIGLAAGYGIDTFKGLAKIGDASRHPAWTERLSRTQAAAVATTLVAGSVSLIYAIYGYAPRL